ncbi:MAG TPA: transposase [Flavilitoribacter sp.]|nr:transposase [Flavilitoribacter sp.]
MKTRRSFTSKFKAKVVVEALSERYTLAVAQRHNVHPNQISAWKAQFLEGAESVFEHERSRKKEDEEAQRDELLKTIGQLKVENDFLKKSLR